MELSYKIQNDIYKVIFCNDTEAPDITKELAKVYSDKKALIIIDKKISKNIIKNLLKDLSYSDLTISILKVDGSKSNKNEKLLFKIIDALILGKFTKSSVLISCGGGVVGDVSALAASLYLRGMVYFHIPTTMTAIVDSCIGGKTGINYKNIINSFGNYYHPKAVFISKNIIELIPKREFLSGIPEIIKCGFLKNKKILKKIYFNKRKILDRDFKFLTKLIFMTLKTKIYFFKDDIYEKKKRLSLNFGHTFAHAVEMALKSSKKDLIRHGEAVGIGMLSEIYYSEGKSNNFKYLYKILKRFNLPTNIKKFLNKRKKNVEFEIFKNIFLDKKKINKYPRCIALQKNSEPKIIEMREDDKIKSAINKVII